LQARFQLISSLPVSRQACLSADTSGRKLQGMHTYDDAFFFSDGGEYRFGEKIFANERRLVKSVY